MVGGIVEMQLANDLKSVLAGLLRHQLTRSFMRLLQRHPRIGMGRR
jgi:hypothetical protein